VRDLKKTSRKLSVRRATKFRDNSKCDYLLNIDKKPDN